MNCFVLPLATTTSLGVTLRSVASPLLCIMIKKEAISVPAEFFALALKETCVLLTGVPVINPVLDNDKPLPKSYESCEKSSSFDQMIGFSLVFVPVACN